MAKPKPGIPKRLVFPKPRDIRHYNRNPHLKGIGVATEFTLEQIKEYKKCADDPIYFIRTYMNIVHVDHGIIPFDLYGYQEKYIREIHKNRFVISKWCRQSGKSTSSIGYMLHYILFNEAKTVAILANKAATAREILGRLKLAYELLPHWLQQGVVTWNKGEIEIENGSKVVAAASSSSAIRGCVSGDSNVTVRNKLTGEIKTLNMEQLAFVLNSSIEEDTTNENEAGLHNDVK